MNNSNTLLLHSGWLDSSILGCELAKQGINFSSVFIDFGQRGKEYSQGFLDAFSKLVEEAGYTSTSLQAPFLSKTKGDVVKLGAENLELIRSTWSCIRDSDTLRVRGVLVSSQSF